MRSCPYSRYDGSQTSSTAPTQACFGTMRSNASIPVRHLDARVRLQRLDLRELPGMPEAVGAVERLGSGQMDQRDHDREPARECVGGGRQLALEEPREQRRGEHRRHGEEADQERVPQRRGSEISTRKTGSVGGERDVARVGAAARVRPVGQPRRQQQRDDPDRPEGRVVLVRDAAVLEVQVLLDRGEETRPSRGSGSPETSAIQATTAAPPITSSAARNGIATPIPSEAAAGRRDGGRPRLRRRPRVPHRRSRASGSAGSTAPTRPSSRRGGRRRSRRCGG